MSENIETSKELEEARSKVILAKILNLLMDIDRRLVLLEEQIRKLDRD